MSGNNDPLFSRQGDVSANGTTTMFAVLTAAANDFTGAGANNALCFTADSTNGGFIRSIKCKAAGTNVASVVRVFINNGSTNTSATNNVFFTEQALPATTSNAAAATGNDIEIPMFIALNPGFRIYVGLGTAVAAGWFFTPIAGKY